MNLETFLEVKNRVIGAGYGEEIVWSESLIPCDNADRFFGEYLWVVVSSGLKNQVARIIEARVWHAILEGRPITSVFHHQGKAAAIEHVNEHKDELFNTWNSIGEGGELARLRFLETLPWIGPTTRFHLAKNLGKDDLAKPDRHLARVAAKQGTSPTALCFELAKATGLRIATVDLIIWRAANLGFV